MVVALAMVAVFGAMSLANPAMAAIGQPADAELTERADTPQADMMVETYSGKTVLVDITGLVNGGGSNFNGVVTAATTVEPDNLIAGNTDTVIPNTDLFGAIRLTWTAGQATDADAARDGRIYVTLQLKSQNAEGVNETQRLRLDVDLGPATGPDEVGEIEDRTVRLGPADIDDVPETTTQGPGKAISLDVSGYFMDGRGPDNTAAITSYTASIADVIPGDAVAVEHVDDAGTVINGGAIGEDGMLYLRATADEGDLVRVTVVTVPAGGTQSFFVDVGGRTAITTITEDDGITLPYFTQDSNDPGDSTNFTVAFRLGADDAVNTRRNDLVIEFHEDYGVPSTIRNTSVAITTDIELTGDSDREITFTPEDITVDGEKILISVGDVDERDNMSEYDFTGSEKLIVHFRQSAGITTPTEFGGYNLVGVTFGDYKVEYDDDAETPAEFATNIVRKISRDEEDGGLGKVVTATGKGYKNGTSLTVFLDSLSELKWDDPDTSSDSMVRVPMSRFDEYVEEYEEDSEIGNIDPSYVPLDDDDDPLHYRMVSGTGYVLAPNRLLEAGEDVLCVDADINSDDVGSCEFTVTHPTFAAGLNYINAVDGKNGYAKPTTFLLKASIQATPDGGSPGEIMLVQVVDFKSNIGKVTIGGQVWCSDAGDSDPDGETRLCAGTVDNSGAGNFKITIPNWVRAGAQELKVFDDRDPAASATDSVTLLGPQINVSPKTVLGNQRISLVGTGFSPGAVIANDRDADQLVAPEISIGGDPIDGGDINDNDPVRVDNGGNWSASVDLPLSEATTAVGERAIRVRDSQGRTGVVLVDVPGREVTITPERGRVGTNAVVRGKGFPSKNDEGESFNIEIVYDASNDNTTTVSALPDASGRFEVQLRIPTTAAIPSTNSVKVEFEDENDVKVVTTVTHEVRKALSSCPRPAAAPVPP